MRSLSAGFSLVLVTLSLSVCAQTDRPRALRPGILEMRQGFFGLSYFEGGQRIPRSEVKALLLSEGETYLDFKSGNALNIAGQVLGTASSAVFGYTLAVGLSDLNDIPVVVPVTAGIATVGFVVMRYVGQRRMRDAIGAYNAAVHGTSYGLNVTEHGAGLVVTF